MRSNFHVFNSSFSVFHNRPRIAKDLGRKFVVKFKGYDLYSPSLNGITANLTLEPESTEKRCFKDLGMFLFCYCFSNGIWCSVMFDFKFSFFYFYFVA